ncbi:MAG: DUF11 domain-containing protein, partial [Chloroflexi bacterium]|nr:DUF11 domain-containing protein [Chloroflexota bacterium]
MVTNYAADSSPYVTDPSDMLYADACLWENDVNSPNYRACLSAGKAGGAPVTVTYNVTIISGGGTQQTLNSLLYDFSGSSYHYNSDFSAGARFANIIDPTTATIEKDFVPALISNGGVATLVFTLRNPNDGALSDYNFTDTLPTGMTIVNPPAPITSSCGSTAAVNAPNGGNTISFSGGTLAANGTCTISVTVTAPVVTSPSTTYNNTSNNLFIGTVNTGDNAADSLTVTDAPLPPACTTIPMATWTFATAGSATAPTPATANVTATAAAGPGLSLPAPAAPIIGADRLGTAGSGSWQADNITDDTPPGLVLANNEYFEFVLNTTGFNSVTLQFYTDRSAQGAVNAQLYYGPVTGTETASTIYTVPNAWTLQAPTVLNTGLNPTGSTRFRLYVYDSGNNNNGHYVRLDDVTFTGCGVPRGPTITKNFAPDPIAAGATSTLTFTLTNPNTISVLNNVSFTDNLPAGMTVAATPAASTTCGGTWNPLANALTLSFTGGVIPANGTCTLQVNVTTSVLGPSTNISGFISSNESGVNNSSTGSATDTLTVIAPPQIDKVFSPNPIVAGGTSRLTFVITNPNQSNGISGVAFTDTLPAGVPGPGSMTVAAVPSPTNTCGGTWTTNPGAGSVNLAGVNIGAGVTCTVSVLVTVPSAGSYANTSGNVSHIVNGVPVNGNTTSDTLLVNAPNPGIRILKQIGLGGLITDPWSSYLAVAPATPVYYLVTIENIGDVPLNITSVTDPNLAALIAACTWTNPLPVADALDDDHIDYCILGPVPAATGVHTNTATVNAQYGVNPLPPQSDSATYATTGLTIDKVANPTTYTAAGNVINYTITITNTGSAILNGPVTVTDSLIPTLTCPALNTIGNNNNFFDPVTSVPTEILICTGTHTITPAEVTAGSVPNTATADTSQTAPVTDNVTVSLQNPALTLAKTGTFVDGNGDTLPQAGETINYTFLMTNIGNVVLTNVTVTDPLVPIITCPSGNPIPNLAIGGSQTCTGSYTLVAADITAGQVLNTATADSDQTPPVTDNETVILAAPALTLAKTGAFVDGNGDNAAQVGETINYTFLVTNTGNVALTNVAVTDPLITTITCPSGNPIPNLAIGASQTCTGTYTLVAADITAGQVLNTATADSDQTPPVTDNETVNLAVPALTLVKTGVFVDGNGDNAAQVGETINYTFLVTNTGNVALTNVAVTDPLIATITCPSGNPIPNLAVGGSQTCTGTYTLVAADITAGQVLNTATADSDQTPPVTDNETINLAVPGLTLAKTGAFVDGNGDNAAQVGETINYTFLVTNTGNVALTTVAVTDPLITTITCPSGNPIPNLAVGGSQTCTGTYTLVAADITAGQVLNTATADSDQTPPVTDNETINLAVPGLTLAKTGAFVDGNGDNAAQVGETINYTFLVTNTGNAALTNVAVTDPLITTITCPSGNPIPNLAVGGSQTCTGTYTLVAADI